MATIKDVAREAGVSVATVSRVFNESAPVKDATRRIVQDVAGRLNYWPNAAARSLITSRTQAIGVLLPDLYGEFYSEILRGMDCAARVAGFHLLVSSSHAHAEELIDALRMMRGRIDSLIVMAPDVDARAAISSMSRDLPIVLIDSGVEPDGCECISIANEAGARALVKHLIGLGHRRIATITGPVRNADAVLRLKGYRAALRAAGLTHGPEHEIRGDFSERSGYEAVARLLALKPRPTAVFAANDYMAIGVLGALSDARVKVPEQIAVVGFDDIAMARYLNPPLTTVHVDANKLGALAVHRLLEAARGGRRDSKRRDVLATNLVVRSSCGSTAANGARTGSARSRGH
jgi:LacI family transcriptional regulator